MAKKSKTVNYRKAELIGKEGEVIEETLESLINRALEAENVPSPVIMDYPIEGQNAHLLLFTKKGKKPYYHSLCLCGCVSLYDDESKVPLVDSEYYDEKDEVFNEQVAPVDSNNKLRKLEQHAHYFAIRDNHVAIMASSGRGIDTLEDFFTLLIQEAFGIYSTVSVKMVNIPKKDAFALMVDKPIRSVSFSSSAFVPYLQQMADTQKHAPSKKGIKKKYIREFHEKKPIIKAFFEFLGCEALLDAYQATDDLEGLSVAVEFKCSKRKDQNEQQLLRDFARHVGGIEELAPIINLSGKSYISKEMLTVKDTLSVEGDGKNLNRYNAMKKLAEWLDEQIDLGLV